MIAERDENAIADLLTRLSPEELTQAVSRAALPPTAADQCRRCGDFVERCECPPILPRNPIEIAVWEPNPDKPGYLRHVRNRTYREVWDHIRPQLAPYVDEGIDLDPCINYSRSRGLLEVGPYDHPEDEIRSIRWVSAWCVPGANEGHYIHVELVEQQAGESKRWPFLLGKTFRGLEHGYDLCRRIVDLVEV